MEGVGLLVGLVLWVGFELLDWVIVIVVVCWVTVVLVIFRLLPATVITISQSRNRRFHNLITIKIIHPLLSRQIQYYTNTPLFLTYLNQTINTLQNPIYLVITDFNKG